MPAPGATFDISQWKLTLPTGTGGDGVAVNVLQPALNTYTDSNFTVTSGLMVMTAPCSGANAATTGGSDGTRCEYFEQVAGANADYPLGSVYRRLTATGFFDPTSITGGSSPLQQGIVGQVHGSSGTPPVYLAIDYDHVPSRLRLFVNGPGYLDLLTGMVPTDQITYRIEIAFGVVYVSAAFGPVAALPLHPQCSFLTTTFTDNLDCFCKAGAYNKTILTSGSSGSMISKFSVLELLQTPNAQLNYTIGWRFGEFGRI